MKTDAALSWKGLSLSAFLHGTVFAAAGALLLSTAEVGTQESPVTAEFQILSDAPSASFTPPERNAEPDKADQVSPVAEGICEPDAEHLLEELPVENVPRDPIIAANSAVASPRPSRASKPSVHHSSAGAKCGARNLMPDYLENPPPPYPESSRLAGEQGLVLVRAGVTPGGRVIKAGLVRSSGHVALDRAAVQAVSRWKFRPASVAGIAMSSEVTVPVRFELRRALDAEIRNP